eukprot:1148744-Pelagomonas_calceolata.AAC.3
MFFIIAQIPYNSSLYELNSAWLEPASLPSSLKLGLQYRQNAYRGIQLRETGQLLPSRPREQLNKTQTSSAYFNGCPSWVRGLGEEQDLHPLPWFVDKGDSGAWSAAVWLPKGSSFHGAHSCMNKACSAAGGFYCCPRHCIDMSMPPPSNFLIAEGSRELWSKWPSVVMRSDLQPDVPIPGSSLFVKGCPA